MPAKSAAFRSDDKNREGEPPLQAQITTLAPDPLEIVRPIPVVIRSNGDDFVASFFDANVHATGDTDQEAFENLRDVVSLKFRLFERSDDSALGEETRRQYAVLRQFIRSE